MTTADAIISSSADLYTYLADRCPALRDEYIDAVVDQILHSDHPAWDEDWSDWLAAELDGVVEAVVDGLDALS